jgi:hypothetical protein
MTRDEAVDLLRGYFKANGLDTPGLNEQNLGGVSASNGDVYFEYLPGEQALKCSALIYRFHDEPRPGVLEGFLAEGRNSAIDRGGGTIDYEPENKGLYLSRTFTRPVSNLDFAADLDRLMTAAQVWADNVVDRIADRALHK